MARNYGMEEPLFIINVTFLVLAWFTCLLRAWAKLVVLRKITPDDYLMICGIVSCPTRQFQFNSMMIKSNTSSRSSTLAMLYPLSTA